jgi:hypothetical protein
MWGRCTGNDVSGRLMDPKLVGVQLSLVTASSARSCGRANWPAILLFKVARAALAQRYVYRLRVQCGNLTERLKAAAGA